MEAGPIIVAVIGIIGVVLPILINILQLRHRVIISLVVIITSIIVIILLWRIDGDPTDVKSGQEPIAPSVDRTLNGTVKGLIVSVKKQETSNRHEEYNWRHGHCQPAPREVCAEFKPRNAEWKIDLDTVLDACNTSSESTCLGIRDKTQNSFKVCGVVQNNGNCVKILDQIIAKDGRGHVWGSVKWQEKREVEIQKPIEIDEKEFTWNDEVIFSPLPTNTVSYELTVIQSDGKPVLAHGNVNAGLVDCGWFTVSATSNQLKIQTKKFNEAVETPGLEMGSCR